MKTKYLVFKVQQLCFLFLVLFTCVSCETHVQEQDFATVEEEEDTCGSDISFATQVQPLVNNKCVVCHNGSQPPNLTTYNNIKSNANNVKQQVVTRRMPLGGSLSSDEIKLLTCWIDNGMLNN